MVGAAVGAAVGAIPIRDVASDVEAVQEGAADLMINYFDFECNLKFSAKPCLWRLLGMSCFIVILTFNYYSLLKIRLLKLI